MPTHLVIEYNMAEQYVNIRRVLDSIMRHPLMQGMSLETAVDYTVEFMRIIGVPDMFLEKTEVLEIENYRALLPCDYYRMIQVRSTERGHPAFRYADDSFHMSQCKCQNDIECHDLTYKIQGSVIFTSLQDGRIEIAYQAIATDIDGYPLLPDNSSFLRALELYIKKKWFTVMFDMGKISVAVLQNTQQEYAWAAGDCQTEFNRLSLDKAESFFNSWRTLIIRDNEHKHGFKHNGSKEYLRLQP